MIEVAPDELRLAVERTHGGIATLPQSVPIRETFDRETVWDGVVHVFNLAGHPRATLAYAWSSPIEGSDKRRFFALLHQPPDTSPIEAVRAAIVAEHRRPMERKGAGDSNPNIPFGKGAPLPNWASATQ